MAFTVFGMMGASGAYGAEGSKGLTVTVNYTDGVSTNKRVIKKTYTQADLKQMAGDPQTGVGTAVDPVYYMVSKGYYVGVNVYRVGEGVKLWSLIRGAAGEDLTADGISSIRFWKDGSLTEYYDGLSSDQILSHLRQYSSPPVQTNVYPAAGYDSEGYVVWGMDLSYEYIKEPVDPVLAIGYETASLDMSTHGKSKGDVEYHPDNDGAGYDSRVFFGILNTQDERDSHDDGSFWAPAESGGLDITLPAAGSIDKAAVTIGSYAKAYDGRAKTPNVTVSMGGKTLVRDKDYTLAFANNVNAGTATVKITGKGAYVGTKFCPFTIAKATVRVTAPKGGTFTYNGKSRTGVASGSNYTLSGTVKAARAGTYTAKATLKSGANYAYQWSDGSTAARSIKWTIKKAANPLSVKGRTASVKGCTKGKNGKLKKTKTLGASKVIAFAKKGQGKLTYAKASGNRKITINKTSGKVTVKKGLKKGTYKVKVKVRASGDANHDPSAWKTVTVRINVK